MQRSSTKKISTRVDVCAGHDACGPRDLVSWSPDVTVENIEVARQGDTLVPHGCQAHPPHPATITHGFATVTVNNKPIAHVGAAVSCPSGTMNTGRRTVTVG